MTARDRRSSPLLLSTNNTGVCLPVNTKYESRNPLARLLIRDFMLALAELVEQAPATTLLDVGCGEGVVMRQLAAVLQTDVCHALDIDSRLLNAAQQIAPTANYLSASIYQLPFPDDCYDLVVCTEVLEHLSHAKNALREVARVSGRYCLLSVPREPWWRVANMLRGKYFFNLGNSPGHVNHWSTKSFTRFVASFLDIVGVRQPFPWTMVLGRVLPAGEQL